MLSAALLLLMLTSSATASKYPPYEVRIIHCDIYPAPNGGFTEVCYYEDGTPAPNPDPTPEPQPLPSQPLSPAYAN